jgi:hypothetical protein
VADLERRMAETEAMGHRIRREVASEFESERQKREEEQRELRGLLKRVTADGVHLETVGLFWLLGGMTLTTVPDLVGWSLYLLYAAVGLLAVFVL